MEPPDCAGMRTRSFMIDRAPWTVCEDTQAGALIFYGPGVARRVCGFPANWLELPEKELYALSWRR